MTDVFGPIFLPSKLVADSEDLLKEWFPDYLPYLEGELGLAPGALKVPANYTQRNRIDSNPGEQLPKVVIVVPGLIGPPQKDGRGVYRGTWRLGVGTMTAAQTEEEAKMLAEAYGAAVRAIFTHHPSINGIASNLNYLDESYDEIPVGNEIQQFRVASVWFAVDIDNVVTKAAGPKHPANVHGTAEKVIIQSGKI